MFGQKAEGIFKVPQIMALMLCSVTNFASIGSFVISMLDLRKSVARVETKLKAVSFVPGMVNPLT